MRAVARMTALLKAGGLDWPRAFMLAAGLMTGGWAGVILIFCLGAGQ